MNNIATNLAFLLYMSGHLSNKHTVALRIGDKDDKSS